MKMEKTQQLRTVRGLRTFRLSDFLLSRSLEGPPLPQTGELSSKLRNAQVLVRVG